VTARTAADPAMHRTDPTTSLALRLDRLERENRRYRRTALGAALGALAWMACGVAQSKTTLAAERIVLLGADGSEKATLEVDERGDPVLLLRNGSTSALLTTNGPSMLLRGPDGKTGAFVGIDSKNTSRLELTSHRVLDGVRLTAHEDGSAGVYVLDTQGRQRAALEAYGPGGSSLNFRDDRGRTRSTFGLDPADLPNAILMDADGGRRLGMVVQEDGNPLLEIADDHGRPRLEITTLFDGSPSLETKTEDGQSSFRAP